MKQNVDCIIHVDGIDILCDNNFFQDSFDIRFQSYIILCFELQISLWKKEIKN